MSEPIAFGFKLADLAASISLPRYRSRAFAVETKPDGSPVTDVDIEIESALRAHIAERHPDHEILGEELGHSGASPLRWYLDPIDGTVQFVEGAPGWMTLIALEDRGAMLFGIVDLPAVGERWWASRGEGACHDGQRVGVSDCRRLGQATVNDTWRHDLARGNRRHPLWSVAQRAGRVRPNQGHGMLAVASGLADVAVQMAGRPWDYASLKVIVDEAGGAFTDLAGGDRLDTGAVVATNGHLHDEVLALLAKSQG